MGRSDAGIWAGEAAGKRRKERKMVNEEKSGMKQQFRLASIAHLAASSAIQSPVQAPVLRSAALALGPAKLAAGRLGAASQAMPTRASHQQSMRGPHLRVDT